MGIILILMGITLILMGIILILMGITLILMGTIMGRQRFHPRANALIFLGSCVDSKGCVFQHSAKEGIIL